jgi:macrolide phosphotransferase
VAAARHEHQEHLQLDRSGAIGAGQTAALDVDGVEKLLSSTERRHG